MTGGSYEDFVSGKLTRQAPTGITGGFHVPGSLFPHQSALTAWALRRGRAAIFADTGLGKMRMELAWAAAVRRHTKKPVIIMAPLAVAAQIAAEGAKIDIEVQVCREASDVTSGINVTNYDRLHKFDTSIFGGVVLDESGCIKHHDAKTFRLLTDAFHDTPFKLPASATPAPNDWTELGTHAEFLGICTRAEMLAEFFTHDGGDTSVWRLKGHARQEFWKWVATWGAMVRRPSDLGFDDSAYVLPPLNYIEHHVECETPAEGMLFPMEAQTLAERRDARRASMVERVQACADTVFEQWGEDGLETRVRGSTQEPWLIWCELNGEQDALEKRFGTLAFSVRGANTTEEKEQQINAWLAGERPVMISKPSILGWGLNFQHCARMAFVGVTDSFESYYQAVRRCWRFGQKRPVDVHVFASTLEGAVVANLRRKEQAAIAMSESLGAETRESVFAEVRGSTRETNTYDAARRVAVPQFITETA